MGKERPYFKKIDWVFYNERAIRAIVLDIRNGVNDHESNGSGVSDPTAAQAIRNVTPIRSIHLYGCRLEWPEAWLHVTDMVRTLLDTPLRKVMEGHYRRQTQVRMTQEVNVNQSTVSKMWREIRHVQELCAVQEGLIRVY